MVANHGQWPTCCHNDACEAKLATSCSCPAVNATASGIIGMSQGLVTCGKSETIRMWLGQFASMSKCEQNDCSETWSRETSLRSSCDQRHAIDEIAISSTGVRQTRSETCSLRQYSMRHKYYPLPPHPATSHCVVTNVWPSQHI